MPLRGTTMDEGGRSKKQEDSQEMTFFLAFCVYFQERHL
jgi:hypothetical protein